MSPDVSMIFKIRPHKGGGLFGVPKAWLRVVEEQSRLTLYAHFLIWIYGHGNLQFQLKQAVETDPINKIQSMRYQDSTKTNLCSDGEQVTNLLISVRAC